MMTNKNKFPAIFLAIASGVHLVRFLLYYISTYLAQSVALTYISLYFSEIVYLFLPLLTAALLIKPYADGGFPKSLILAIPISLAEIIYILPYRLFELAYQGYEIGETLFFSIIITLITLMLNYLRLLLLLSIIIFLTRLFAKSQKQKASAFAPSLEDKDPFDFSRPLTKGIFGASLTVFAFALISEIIDTVNFLLVYSGNYRMSEVLYMLFRYVFILAVLITSHVFAHFISIKLLRAVKD